MRTTATLAIVTGATVLALGVAPHLSARAVRYEHRVVVPTTGLGREIDVAASLERNVNALAARGFALAAMAGGDSPALDAMLRRRAFATGTANDDAVTLAVMVRPEGTAGVAREYRLLHVRELERVDQVIAPLGAQGFRLALVEFDGPVVHVAFEKTAGAAPVEFREFRNKGRRSWMDQLMADADVRARMTRVVPIALGAGIVELGSPQSTPGEVSWLSKPTHAFEQLEGPLGDLAKTGHRVELVRRRGPNDLDVLVVKPAGAAGAPASYDLDDGPWGSACGRGTIAGAAVGPDGDVYCAADRGGSAPPANDGLDLTVRAQPSAGGGVFFRGLTCDLQARLGSARPASPRVAFALQMEREITRAAKPGFRVTRALAAVDGNGQARLVVFTTDAAPAVVTGAPADASPAPPLVAELDTVGDDLTRQREAQLNAMLAGRNLPGGALWLELDGGRGRTARLLGCVSTRVDRETAESAAKGALINQGLIDYKVVNRVVVDR
ncbi:MAG: hypothetical protein AB7O28_25385 [Vicinamibacterales bacterium]